MLQSLLRDSTTHLTARMYWQLGLMLAIGNPRMSDPEDVNQLSSDVPWGKSPRSLQR